MLAAAYAATQFALPAATAPAGGWGAAPSAPANTWGAAAPANTWGAAAPANTWGAAAPASAWGAPPPSLAAHFAGVAESGAFSGLLLIAAAALVVTRFIPFAKAGDSFVWSWSEAPGAFLGLVFPLLAAAAYAAAALLPAALRQRSPWLNRWVIGIVALIALCIFAPGYPAATAGTLMGKPAPGASHGAGMFFVVLVAGLLGSARSPGDRSALVLVALGAIGTVACGLSDVKHLVTFKGVPAAVVVYQLAWLTVLVGAAAAGAVALVPSRHPVRATLARVVPALTLVLLLWPVAGALLFGIARASTGGASAFLLTVQLLVFVFAFGYGAAFTLPGVAQGIARAIASASSPHGHDMPGGYPPNWQDPAAYAQHYAQQQALQAQHYAQQQALQAPPPALQAQQLAPPPAEPAQFSYEQQLAALDAAWHRGGMAPETYSHHRAQIERGRVG